MCRGSRVNKFRCNELCLALLLLCGDIETNAEPLDICLICKNLVLEHYYAVYCDRYSYWYHIKCINMAKSLYQTLVKIDSFQWHYPNCSDNI